MGEVVKPYHYVDEQGKAQFSKARKKKNFFDEVSNSVRPFDYIMKAGQPARPKTKTVTREWRNHATVSDC